MPQHTNTNNEAELIGLLLKRQSELNSLLEITRAINKNSSTQVLVDMLEVILKNYLNVGKFRFMVEKFGNFACISKFGGNTEQNSTLYKACSKLGKNKQPTPLAGMDDAVLSGYDYYIPIFHKSKLLSFALVGDFNTDGEMLSNDLDFIQTLINVIVVALENKKLIRERMQAERFQREMELAVEVQNMLIPVRLIKEPGFEIGAKYLPHQNIGGDYFDFFRINQNEFMWCIADVSGKGVSAAMLMANFQASLRAWATVETDMPTLMEKLNHILINNTKGERFITLFLGKYNEATRKLTYINAGHNAPIVYANGKAVHLKLGTTMIGAFDELPFLNEGEIDVEPGSMIFNYTDGLLDYEPEDKDVWNEDELKNFVVYNGYLNPDEFNQKLLATLNQMVKTKPIDDITLLTIRIF